MRDLTDYELDEVSGGAAFLNLTADGFSGFSARVPAAEFALALPEFHHPKTVFQSVMDSLEDSLEAALGLTNSKGGTLK